MATTHTTRAADRPSAAGVRQRLGNVGQRLVKTWRADQMMRRWPQTCELLGWTQKLDAQHVRVPKLHRVAVEGESVVFVFSPLTKHHPEQWAKLADELARLHHAAAHDWKAVGRGRLEVTLFRSRLSSDHAVTASMAASRSWSTIPIGNGFRGPVMWDVNHAPHLLVSGDTGSGKSSLLRRVVLGTSDHWHLALLDPKRVEFAFVPPGGRVVTVASGVLEVCDVLGRIAAEVENRYKAMQAAKVQHWTQAVDICPLLVIVDELSVLSLPAFGEDERAAKKRISDWKASLLHIANLGRACGIHLVLGVQRPDAEFFSGAVRSQLRGRIGLGRLDAEGSRMMFGADAVALAAQPLPRSQGWMLQLHPHQQTPEPVSFPLMNPTDIESLTDVEVLA